MSSLNVKLYQYIQHLLTDLYSIIVHLLVKALHFYLIISGSGRLTSRGYLFQENCTQHFQQSIFSEDTSFAQFFSQLLVINI